MNLKEISKLNEDQAREYLERIRWPEGPVCPFCQHPETMRLKGTSTPAGTIKCKQCRAKFTVRVGTIFERSHIELRTWLMAFSIICSSKKGVSAKQLQRQLGLGSYKSAWHMAHRIRHAMAAEPLATMLNGTIEMDETYIGGKPRTGQRSRRGRGAINKVPVVGLVESTGKGRAKARVVADVSAKTFHTLAKQNISGDAKLHTDEWAGHNGLSNHFANGHERVSHKTREYFREGVTTNNIESFWSLLKRGITGSFHKVSVEHLQRYLDEFCWRWSHRDLTDAERTDLALRLTEGKRLMYKA